MAIWFAALGCSRAPVATPAPMPATNTGKATASPPLEAESLPVSPTDADDAEAATDAIQSELAAKTAVNSNPGTAVTSASEAETLALVPEPQATTEQPPPELPPAERIMLLTESGPLLVDLHITIGGRPYRDNFDTVIDDVMAIADDDKDGIVTWDGIMRHPRFRAGQFGNPATTTYQAQQDMIRLYDTTKNDRVDPDELIRYLTSGRGTSNALSLYTSNYRRVRNRDDSPIRKWLDANDDLVLDAAEIGRAGSRLRLRDTDDDEVLTPNDFIDVSAVQGMPGRRRPRDSEYLPKVGWHVRAKEPWSDIRVAWNHYYGVGLAVQAEDLMLGEALFTRMDVDESGTLDNIEMELLADVEADIALEVKLATPDAGNPMLELAALRIADEYVEAIVQHQPNRITVALTDTSLDLFVRDNVGYAQYEQQAMNFLRQGDADNNSYLDEEEFGSVAQFFNVEFAAADLDGNQKVFQDELVTILEQRNIVSRNQINVRADDQDDALFPTLDTNSDGRIDSREIAQAKGTLLAIDQNDDGEIHLHELRGSMMVGIVRGGNLGQLSPGDTTFQVPAVARQATEATPRWFRGMDRNQDGGISWREFLGTRQQFDDLDADADGFVIVDELRTE